MYKKKVILFFSIILLSVFLLSIAAIRLCIKYPLYIPAEYWLPEAISIKEHYAKTIKEPKIIVIGGSSSLFGICTSILGEKTHKKIANFGLHAGLPLEVLFSLIKRNANSNDIVLMPLEYGEYFTREKKFSNWEITNLTTWGTEFIKEFPITQQIEMVFQTLPSIPERIKNFNFNLPIRTYKEYMQDKNPSAILSKVLDYSNSVNYFGDHLQDTQSKLKNDFTDSYFNSINLNDYRFQQVKEFAEILAKQNIRLLLTYPVSIQNPHFDLSNKEHFAKIEALNNKIQEHGLNIIGIPELSNFELTYSLDTRYHLNAEGAILRSLYLADTINCCLADKAQEIADLEAYKKNKTAEAKQILEEYRKLGYFFE